LFEIFFSSEKAPMISHVSSTLSEEIPCSTMSQYVRVAMSKAFKSQRSQYELL